MTVSTQIKDGVNALLRPLNVRVDSWTTSDREQERIRQLDQAGKLREPLYPLTDGMRRFDADPLVQAYAAHGAALARLNNPEANQTGYDPANTFFTTPDAEVLYLMVRTLAPKRIIEIGCGNSTRIVRQAIADGQMATHLTGVDPHPRAAMAHLVDRLEQRRVEDVEDLSLFHDLDHSDILFIDSSHTVQVGNDVAFLFCKVLPALKKGVVIHVHDVFLPYEYPSHLAFDNPQWGEQYVLHALLQGRDCDVLWPGHYVQRDHSALAERLPFLSSGIAQSFWFRW